VRRQRFAWQGLGLANLPVGPVMADKERLRSTAEAASLN
jgi:hypothetical protein